MATDVLMFVTTASALKAIKRSDAFNASAAAGVVFDRLGTGVSLMAACIKDIMRQIV